MFCQSLSGTVSTDCTGYLARLEGRRRRGHGRRAVLLQEVERHRGSRRGRRRGQIARGELRDGKKSHSHVKLKTQSSDATSVKNTSRIPDYFNSIVLLIMNLRSYLHVRLPWTGQILTVVVQLINSPMRTDISCTTI